MQHRLHVTPGVAFVSAVTALLAIEVAAGIPLRSSPDVVIAAAITIDVAVGLPLIGWLFLVRRRGMSPVILAPLFLLGVFAAGAVVPDNVDRPVEVARRLLPVIEGVVVIAMALKVRHRATMQRADQLLMCSDLAMRRGSSRPRSDCLAWR